MKPSQQLDSFLESLGGEKRIHYALDHFKEALRAVGNPEQAVKSILIGGTNGKGTTTLLISQALKAHGFRVTTYLSPHLTSPTERLLENLSPIAEEELLGLAQEHEPIARKYALTYFEYLTLLFFLFAKGRKSDFSVIEVGLGGRLDATNVTDPIATCLTNISYDHQALLGNTLDQILKEKLGVLRDESLFFSGVDQPHLRKEIEASCEKHDAVFYYSSEIRTEIHQRSWEGQEISLNGYRFFLTNPSPGTVANAALAFLTLRIVFPLIPVSTLQQAFQQTQTPGRFQTVHHRPRVILSGDHNPAGIECLKQTIQQVNRGRIVTVCAFSPDKPFESMYQELKTFSDDILLTQVPRLQDKTTDLYRAMGPFEPDAHRAMEIQFQKLHSDDTLLITGSLYLLGSWNETPMAREQNAVS